MPPEKNNWNVKKKNWLNCQNVKYIPVAGHCRSSVI